MNITKHFTLATLLVIAVAIVIATPTATTAGPPKWFMKDAFVNVGDEPHAAGWWGIDMTYKDLTVSCRGLTPGDRYYVANGAGVGIGWLIADKNGTGGFTTQTYPNVISGVLVYRYEAGGGLVLAWGPY